MITGIVVALPDELTTLTAKRIDKGHCVFIGDKLLVAYSGAGPQNAWMASELLVSKGATQLISWGCAAALSASLKPGDLSLADKLIGDDDAEIMIDADWHRYSKDLLSQFVPVHSGCLTESKNIVASSKDKKQLQAITGAVALDMESIAIAKVAKQHALPFLAIRAIVDPAGMSLPGAVVYSVNDKGDVQLGRLLLFLLLHPFELPGLIRLGLYFKSARKTLKKVSKQLVEIVDFNRSHTIEI